MTYIIGLKTEGCVFLCADTVATRLEGAESKSTRTSFGELEIYNENKSVTERALKLINLGRAIAAAAGNYRISRRVLEALSFEIVGQSDIKLALANALRSTEADIGGCDEIRLIVSGPEEPEPILLAYDGNSELRIDEIHEDEFIQFGSMPEHYEEITASLARFIPYFTKGPNQRLAEILTLLQNYGINDYLLEHGVGGAFVGAYVTSSGIGWQDDILYFVYRVGGNVDLDNLNTMNVQLISTSIRDNVVVIQSWTNRTNLMLCDSLSGIADENWFNRWSDELNQRNEEARYDFYSFLAIGRCCYTVIEMRKQVESANLNVYGGLTHSDFRIVTSDDVKNSINQVFSTENYGFGRLFYGASYLYEEGPLRNVRSVAFITNPAERGGGVALVLQYPCYLLMLATKTFAAITLDGHKCICVFTSKESLKAYCLASANQLEQHGTLQVNLERVTVIEFRNAGDLIGWLKSVEPELTAKSAEFLVINPPVDGQGCVAHAIRKFIEDWSGK